MSKTNIIKFAIIAIIFSVAGFAASCGFRKAKVVEPVIAVVDSVNDSTIIMPAATKLFKVDVAFAADPTRDTTLYIVCKDKYDAERVADGVTIAEDDTISRQLDIELINPIKADE